MSRYEPLADYLKHHGSNSIPMSFTEVEGVLGRSLPPSAYKHRPWWANEARGHSHAKAWLEAGYETAQVDMENRKLVFKRTGAARGTAEAARDFAPMAPKAGQHPLIGSMKGTFTIEPGYDLTSPMFTDEEWSEIEKEMNEDWDQIEQGMTSRDK